MCVEMGVVHAEEHSSFLKCILSTLELLTPVCDNSCILSLIAETGKANVPCSLGKGKGFMRRRKEHVGKPTLMFLVVWKFYPGELCATVQFPSRRCLEQILMKLSYGKYFSGMRIKTGSHESAVLWKKDKCM